MNIRNIIRILYQNKLFTIINLVGLSIGIASALLIFFWVDFHLGFDSHPENANDIYRIIYNQEYPNQILKSAVSPAPLGSSLVEDYPEVMEFSRYSIFFGEVLISFNDRRFYEHTGAYADPGFLKMFSIEFLAGNKESSLTDPYSIILTEHFAEKYFGNENPIGKIMLLENFSPLIVTGVIKDIPQNSHLQFEFLVPFILMEKWGAKLNDWNNWAHSYTYIQLTEKTSQVDFEQKILHYLDKYELKIKGKPTLQPLDEIHLNNSIAYDNYSTKSNKMLLYLFAFIGFIIILVASINYMYLSTAKFSSRAKEVGIRKILGASKIDLYKQFFWESFVVVFFSFLLGLVITELLRQFIDSTTGLKIILNYNNFELFSLTLISLTSIVALISLYPSFFLSSFNIVLVLKGILRSHKNAFLYRKLLVVFQFSLAISLIIISIIIFQQVTFIKNKNLGYNTDEIIAVQLRGKDRSSFNSFKKELLQHRDIKFVSSGSSFSTINSSTTDNADWKTKNPNDNFEIFSAGIDFDYIEMFEIPVIKGRSFSKAYARDSLEAFIINETAARVMNMKNPIGEKISFIGKEGFIVGVVKDFNYTSLFEKIGPLILSIRNDWRNYVFIKFDAHAENKEEVINFVEQQWNKYSPVFPFVYENYNKVINDQYLEIFSISKTILYFSFLAIVIALLGLFALSLFMIEHRTKEIGIRKVNGATVFALIRQINMDFIKTIFLSYIISCPIAFIISDIILDNFAYRIEINIWSFIIGGIISIFITIVTTNYQIIYAARKNPVDCLRYE